MHFVYCFACVECVVWQARVCTVGLLQMLNPHPLEAHFFTAQAPFSPFNPNPKARVLTVRHTRHARLNVELTIIRHVVNICKSTSVRYLMR